MERSDIIRILSIYRDIPARLRFIESSGMHSEEAEKEKAKLVQMRHDVSVAFMALKPIQRGAIADHFLHGKNWDIVRRKYCYSEKQIRNISNIGLKLIGQKLESSAETIEFLERDKAADTI